MHLMWLNVFKLQCKRFIQLTIMVPSFFEKLCKRTSNATHFISDNKHSVLILINIYQLFENPSIFIKFKA